MATAALPERLTHELAEQTLEQLASRLAALGAAESLEVDAAALRQYDSSALSVLMGLQRRARAAGRRCHVLNAPARLEDLARAYGVLGLLQDAPASA